MKEEARLLALFQKPRAEGFAPEFLAKVPFAKIEKVLGEVKRWGEARDVRASGAPVTDSARPSGALDFAPDRLDALGVAPRDSG